MNLLGSRILAEAVINITANTRGLDFALGETRRQMSGFLTIANAIGGKLGGAIGGVYGANFHGGGGGLGAVANAIIAARGGRGGAGAGGPGGNPASGAAIPAGMAAVAIAGVVGGLELLAANLRKAAEAASDLQEAVAKTEQTFGSNKGIVGAQAEDLASRYGVARRETHGLSSSAGLLLQGAGIDEKSSASMGASLSKLAAEASSFFNVPVEEAMRKIQSGLSGMSRPLREFGVMLTERKVEAKAFEMGLVGVDGVLTDAAKTVARYTLITDGLSRAIGDIDRSQDRFSMQVRMLQGNFENLAATIGTQVLPEFTLFLSMLNSMTQGAEKSFSFLGKLRQVVGGVTGDMIGVAMFGGKMNNPFNHLAEAPEDTSAIDRRNQDLVDEQLKLSAEEAALRKNGKRGAGYTDLQGLNRKIQDAISGDQKSLLRDLAEISKKQVDLQKRIAKALEDKNKRPAADRDWRDSVPF